ncbi:MAG: autotransporter outer membrane beta-barrel domain-containing protein [Sutterella wadsworthensis]|nr:autotransporter outer membrane beta-barrel domain-containing protein [Sutterella wadsworthensis]
MVEVDGKDTWIEYGFGGNFNLMKDTYFWGDVERTSGADLDTDWRATMGVRYVF